MKLSTTELMLAANFVTGDLVVTLTAASNYTLAASGVKVTMGGVDITAMAYDNSTSKVTIAEVTSSVVITATATAST